MYIQEENKNRMDDQDQQPPAQAVEAEKTTGVEEQKPLEVPPVVERKPLTEDEFKNTEAVYLIDGKEPVIPKPDYEKDKYYATPAPVVTEQAAAAEQTSAENAGAGSAVITTPPQNINDLAHTVAQVMKTEEVQNTLKNPSSGGRRTRRRNKKSGKKSRRQSKKGGKKHRNTGSKKSKKSRRYSSRK
jgi:hypothetical protein